MEAGIYDFRKLSSSFKLLETSKQTSQINFKLAISDIYKSCPLIPILFERGVLRSHWVMIAKWIEELCYW